MAGMAESVSETLVGMAGRDPASVRRRVEAMEKLLEGMITIPGINFRLGLDVILDIIPVGGSVVATIMGAWMAWEARNLGMPRSAIVRMGGNIGFDAFLGIFTAIPVIGAIPDLFFRSNTRNLKIIKTWLDKHHPGTATINN
jgi:Domain of unknown function (DUF4112)